MMWLPISMVSVAIWWILPCAECPPSNAAAALPICEEALVEWIMPLDYTGNCPPPYYDYPSLCGFAGPPVPFFSLDCCAHRGYLVDGEMKLYCSSLSLLKKLPVQPPPCALNTCGHLWLLLDCGTLPILTIPTVTPTYVTKYNTYKVNNSTSSLSLTKPTVTLLVLQNYNYIYKFN